jgi:hypothetical protein
VADNMQRGSNRLNVHRDDEAKRELQGLLHSGHPTRAEEWDDAEPGADDDPAVTEGPVPAPGSATWEPGARREAEDEELRSQLARHLDRKTFPADRGTLQEALAAHGAPEQLRETVEELPGDGDRYRNVQEVMAALGRKPKA